MYEGISYFIKIYQTSNLSLTLVTTNNLSLQNYYVIGHKEKNII